MRFLFLVVLLSITALAVNAQNLPHYMTEQEKKLMPVYLENISSKGITTPPDFPVRSAAEWEEMQGVVISWQQFTSVLTQIVGYSVNQGKVYIASEYPSSVQSTLTSAGISMDSIVFLTEPTNSIWIRDFGPNNVYANNTDSLLFVDWVYNRPRPLDDVLPAVIADELGVPMYETTTSPYRVVGTGGNFMSDGFGTGFSSELILEESSWQTEQQIKDIFYSFMGIDEYVLMETLPYDGIHHIDMHIKLLNEETLLVGQYPVGVADGPQIEENLQYVLDNFQTAFGTPFKVVRIPMPPDAYGDYPDDYGDYRTYTNSLILNKLVMVPIYGADTDDDALEIYRNAMPGYEVVGIDCNGPIALSGAIHCITHELGVYKPLLISHQPLTTADAVGRNFMVTAYLEHQKGIANAQVMYRTSSDETFAALEMTNDVDSAELWHAQIPITMRTDSTVVEYYVKAISTNGKEQVRPITAPEGFWTFKVANGANAIPVANAGVNQTIEEGQTVTLDGTASYDGNADALTYNWYTNADIEFNDNTLAEPTFIAPMVSADTTIQIYLKVSDGVAESAQDMVEVTILNAVSITDETSDNAWKVYPNPANGFVYISFANEVPELLRVIGADGRVVLSETPTTGFNVFQINTNDFNVGMYVVQVVYANSVQTKRLVIKK